MDEQWKILKTLVQLILNSTWSHVITYTNLMPNGGIWNPIKQNNINNNTRSFGLHRLRESLKWIVALIILIKN